MMNVFRLCSIINSMYGQVAGDLETCSRLWRIMSPPRLRFGATRFTTAVNIENRWSCLGWVKFIGQGEGICLVSRQIFIHKMLLSQTNSVMGGEFCLEYATVCAVR